MIQKRTAQPDAQVAASYDAAAEALVAALPVTTPVTARRSDSAPAAEPKTVRSLATASFVGEASADLALSLEPSVLGDSADLDPTLVSIDDVLRPALESATGVLGTGVLSSTGADSAQSILQDSRTAVYTLSAGEAAVGWFAIRLRDPNAAEAAVNSELPAPLHGAAADWGSTSQNGQSAAHGDVSSRLSRLRNVNMGLSVEIGRARVSVRDVLELESGAVIELDRNAGAPADVRLNGRLIAQGEVVVMDQDYGVRITKILDSAEGLQ